MIDLVREIRGCAVPSTEFEFALIRTSGGILDLEHALVEDWSPVRSSEAIRAFQRLIGVYGGDRSLLARLTRHGHHYDAMFPGFTARSHRYIDGLVDEKWTGEWPYAAYQHPMIEVIARKIAFKAGARRAAMYSIFLAAPTADGFLQETRSYLGDVLSSHAKSGDDTVVTHNAFEPFDPTRSMRFFNNARVIVVDRDPRDVYVAAHRYVGTNRRRGWTSATTDSVKGFIRQFRIARQKVRYDRDDSRVLRIRFEDLINRYDRTVETVLAFVGKTKADHRSPRAHFDPARSAAGVGLWQTFDDRRAIAAIEEQLPEFCTARPAA